MKRRKKQKGFTLIELVLVIVILGILAVAAIPQFIDVSTRAAQESYAGVAGAVREGIGNARAADLVANGPPGDYPATLGGAVGACSVSNACFGNVLDQAVTDGAWSVTATGYSYSEGTVTAAFTYSSVTGAFTETP